MSDLDETKLDENWFEQKPMRQLNDKEALIRLNADYEQAQTERGVAIQRAARYLNIYKTLDPPDDRITESTGMIEDDESIYSNTYMGIGAAVVDSAVSKLYNMLFSTSHYFNVESDDFQDGLFATHITGHLMKRHREMKFKKTVYEVLQEACCFDFAVTYTRWLLEDGYAVTPTKSEEVVTLGALKTRRRNVVAEPRYIPDKIDRSDIVRLNSNRCYPDWTATHGLEDSRFFIDDIDVPLEDLIRHSKETKEWGRYQNIREVVKAVAAQEKKELDQMTDPVEKKAFISSRRVKVVRYWTRNHLVEASQGYIIRRKNLLGWALQIWKIFSVPNEFAGMGFLQRLERNQYDINASLNSRRNFQNLVSNPWAVIDQSLLNESEGEPRLWPGRIFASSGGVPKDKVHVYTPGINTNQDSMTDIAMQSSMVEQQSGISENSQGTFAQGRKTAAETNEVAAGAIGRIATTAELIETTCLEPIYLQQFHLEQIMLTKSEWFLYHGQYGDQMLKVDPSTYMWNSTPRFKAQGSIHAAQDAVKTQQFMAAIDRAMLLQEKTGVKFNWQNISVQMMRMLVPENYFEFITDPGASDTNIPPETENYLIALGRPVAVSPLNNQAEHIQSHEALKNSADYQIWNSTTQMALDRHILEHGQAQAPTGGAGQGIGAVGAVQDPADALRGIRPGSVGVTP